MPVVDFHAHWTPTRYRTAIAERGEWFGLDAEVGELQNSGFVMSLEQRMADMDALGIDMQVLSSTDGFYQYDKPLETTVSIARECNDEIAEIVRECPNRFAGMATLPMQDVPSAIAELTRAVEDLGLIGAMIDDHVLSHTYDEPQFSPFWEAVSRLGALIFFHQGVYPRYRFGRYHLTNSIGNHVERTATFAALAIGGVLDRFPDLKLLFAHGGGYVPYAVARMDKAAGAFEGDDPSFGDYTPPYKAVPDYDSPASDPPSAYVRRFYYDTCSFSGRNLRFMIDTIGADRIVLGTDAPAPMVLTDAVQWIRGLDCLTEQEKETILVDNATRLLTI